MKPFSRRIGILLPLFLSGFALAAGHRHKKDGAVFTEPSGGKGSGTLDIVTTPDFFGVQAIKLWDFDRRTCQVQLEQASLNAAGSAVLDAHKICEPKLAQAWKRADVGQSQFVTAIAVCTKRSKDPSLPVRGIRLWGASVGATGKLSPAKAPVNIEFAGCEKWYPKSACPAGTIATGVRAMTDGEAGAVGFALRCHAIETVP